MKIMDDLIKILGKIGFSKKKYLDSYYATYPPYDYEIFYTVNLEDVWFLKLSNIIDDIRHKNPIQRMGHHDIQGMNNGLKVKILIKFLDDDVKIFIVNEWIVSFESFKNIFREELRDDKIKTIIDKKI